MDRTQRQQARGLDELDIRDLQELEARRIPFVSNGYWSFLLALIDERFTYQARIGTSLAKNVGSVGASVGLTAAAVSTVQSW